MNRKLARPVGSILLVLGLVTPARAQIPPVHGRSSLLPGPVTASQASRCGPGHPWQGEASGVNPFSRARQVEIPLLSLRADGGLPVSFGLHYSSQAVFSNPALGAKWSHSFDTHLDRWRAQGVERAALVWGNHQVQRFELQGSVWVPLDGYRDRLEPMGNGFALVTKSGERFEFSPGMLAGKLRQRLERILDRNGNALALEYSSQDRLVKVTDPSGREIVFVYDSAGKLIESRILVELHPISTSFTYHPGGSLGTVEYPPVTSGGGPEEYKVTVDYDPSWNVISLEERDGSLTSTSYDPLAPGEVAAILAPGQTVPITWSRPAPGQVAATDEEAMTTLFTYDAQDRLVRREILDKVQIFSFGDADYAHGASSVQSGLGVTWLFDYDPRGNVLGITPPSGERTDFTYDALDRLVRVLEPQVTDAWGAQEPWRRSTSYGYDTNGNTTWVLKDVWPSQPGLSSATYLTYDSKGRLIQITDPNGKVTKYTYDAYGNRTDVQTPAGRTTQFLFEGAAKTFGYTLPSARIDGLGQRVDVVRDEWGRPIALVGPGGGGNTYEYDGLSRLVRMVDATGTTTINYTPGGQVQDVVSPTAGLHYDCYANGLRKQLTVFMPSGTRKIEYVFSKRYELMVLSDGVTTVLFVYDADGRLIERREESGARVEYVYSRGRLSEVRHFDSSGAQLPAQRYSYDYLGNGLLARAIELDGSQTLYGYDFQDRLIQEERSGAFPYSLQFSLDAAGNRLSKRRDGLLTTYSFDDDGKVLQSVTGANPPDVYTWDATGRLGQVEFQQQSAMRRFLYDCLGRMTGVQRFGPQPVWFQESQLEWDGLDRLVRRTEFDQFQMPAVVSSYTHDGRSLLHEERQDTHLGLASLAATWAFGLVAWRDLLSGQESWPMTDGLGSLRGSFDSQGMSTQYTGLFSAHGETIADQGPRPPFAWGADAGLVSTGPSGLVGFDGGWYDPRIGQAVSTTDGGWLPGFSGGCLWPVPTPPTCSIYTGPRSFDPIPIEIVPLTLTGCGPPLVPSPGFSVPELPIGTQVTIALFVAGTSLQNASAVGHGVQGAVFLGNVAINGPAAASDAALRGEHGPLLQGGTILGNLAAGETDKILVEAEKGGLGWLGSKFGAWVSNTGASWGLWK